MHMNPHFAGALAVERERDLLHDGAARRAALVRRSQVVEPAERKPNPAAPPAVTAPRALEPPLARLADWHLPRRGPAPARRRAPGRPRSPGGPARDLSRHS